MKLKTPAPEAESHAPYEARLTGENLRIRYIVTEVASGSPIRAAVSLQVRMEGGVWREAFREGETFQRGKWDTITSAWFRALFRLWVRFGEVAYADLVALCRWEVGAADLRGRAEP